MRKMNYLLLVHNGKYCVLFIHGDSLNEETMYCFLFLSFEIISFKDGNFDSFFSSILEHVYGNVVMAFFVMYHHV